MKTREIKALLRSVPAGSCEGLEQVLPLCREAYGKRRRLRRLRTSETVLRQLRFVALPVWLVQGAVLLAVSLMLGGLSGAERSASLVPGRSAASAVLVALTLLPFHGRGKRYRMDEVEAALDDVNLTRLINAFNELRAHAQLIIITHQQRAMSIADALYGVTMRADGVTAVVSQKLER